MNEKNRKEKNGGAEGGSWCEKESHKEAGEYPAKVGWNGCVARMEGVRLTKRADAPGVPQGRRRPRLSLHDCSHI